MIFVKKIIIIKFIKKNIFIFLQSIHFLRHCNNFSCLIYYYSHYNRNDTIHFNNDLNNFFTCILNTLLSIINHIFIILLYHVFKIYLFEFFHKNYL